MNDASREAFEDWWLAYFDEDSDKVSAWDSWNASRKQALEEATSKFNPDNGAWPCREIIQTIKALK